MTDTHKFIGSKHDLTKDLNTGPNLAPYSGGQKGLKGSSHYRSKRTINSSGRADKAWAERQKTGRFKKGLKKKLKTKKNQQLDSHLETTDLKNIPQCWLQ